MLRDIAGRAVIGQGYQIKIDHEDGAIADIWGDRAPADTTIWLIQGWNLLAMAKDNNGQAYVPEFGVNGIGNLLPGAGYQVKVTEAVDFSYLPDDQDY